MPVGYLLVSGNSEDLNAFTAFFTSLRLFDDPIFKQFDLKERPVVEDWVESIRPPIYWQFTEGKITAKPLAALAVVPELPIQGNQKRSFQRFFFMTNQKAPHEVLVAIANWVADQQKKNHQYSSLLVDTGARLGATSGPSSDTPVPDEAIPFENSGPQDYFDQSLLSRAGLNYSFSSTPTYREKIYEEHLVADGNGVTILVIDTAPFVGTSLGDLEPYSGVDWSSIDGVIDLHPEMKSWQWEEDDRMNNSMKNNGSDSNYPPRDPGHWPTDYSVQSDRTSYPASATTPYSNPYIRAVNFHGIMVANLCRLVAPKATIILVRALDEYGEGDTGQIEQFIINLTNNPIVYEDPDTQQTVKVVDQNDKVVINLSLGVIGSSQVEINAPNLFTAVNYASQSQRQLLFVCAAGNASDLKALRDPLEPAAYGSFPGYSQDFELVYGPVYEHFNKQTMLPFPHEFKPTDVPLKDNPYNLVIGVAACSPRATNFYSYFSHASSIAAPATEIVLDPGCNLELPLVKTKQGNFQVAENGQIVTKQFTVYELGNENKHVPTTVFKPSRYVIWSGTSFASPLVAGEAALLMSYGVPAQEAKTRIWQSALPTPSQEYWNRPREINIGESLQRAAQGLPV